MPIIVGIALVWQVLGEFVGSVIGPVSFLNVLILPLL